jgi:hypothetical protein
MAFSFTPSRSLVGHLAIATAAVSLAAAPAVAFAQTSNVAAPALQTVAYSSSSSGQNPFAGQDIDGRSPASAPDGTMRTVAPQYGGGYGGGNYHRYSDNSRFSHLAFEAGGGFTAPLGNDVNGGFTTLLAEPGTPSTAATSSSEQGGTSASASPCSGSTPITPTKSRAAPSPLSTTRETLPRTI